MLSNVYKDTDLNKLQSEIDERVKTYHEQTLNCNEEIKKIESVIQNRKKELDSLSFFHRGRKKDIETEMASLLSEKQKIEEQINTLKNSVLLAEKEKQDSSKKISYKIYSQEKKVDELKRKISFLREEKSNLLKHINDAKQGVIDEKEYIIIQEELQQADREKERKEQMENDILLIKNALAYVGSPITAQALLDQSPELSNFSSQKTSALLRKLVTEGVVKKNIIGGKAYFEYIGHRRSTQAEENGKEQLEKDTVLIINALSKLNSAVTLQQLINQSPELSGIPSPKISIILL